MLGAGVDAAGDADTQRPDRFAAVAAGEAVRQLRGERNRTGVCQRAIVTASQSSLMRVVAVQ